MAEEGYPVNSAQDEAVIKAAALSGLDTATLADIHNRFSYHPPSTEQIGDTHAEVRGICEETAILLTSLTPVGREQAHMLSKLEEAMMWANAAIARNQGQM